MVDEEQPARSVVAWEPPDIIITNFVGDISADEMLRITTESKALATANPNAFVLTDMSRVGSVSPEARAVAKSSAVGANVRAVVAFGASFHHRVIATLINRAVRVIKGGSHYPVEFFATEADARAWILQRRGREGR